MTPFKCILQQVPQCLSIGVGNRPIFGHHNETVLSRGEVAKAIARILTSMGVWAIA